MKEEKEIIIIGDRVLISPDTSKEQTESGLYLPQGVAEKEKTNSGYIVKVGPGYVLPTLDSSSESWLSSNKEDIDVKFVPLQVKKGDYAIFLRRESLEIEYEEKKYMIVSQSGILAVIRSKIKLN